jgi:hypothetical protein
MRELCPKYWHSTNLSTELLFRKLIVNMTWAWFFKLRTRPEYASLIMIVHL